MLAFVVIQLLFSLFIERERVFQGIFEREREQKFEILFACIYNKTKSIE